MTRKLIPAAVVAALTAASGLAHAQSTPPGVIVAPGVAVTPGGMPTAPTPVVPGAIPRVNVVPGTNDRAASPLPSASNAVSPQAGSLSGSVEDRNRSQGDRLGTPYGNGSISPSGTGSLNGTSSSPGSLTR
ncbi:MAG: hypothetical protein WAQ08_14220 [Aquabacterium sp.]|jgi:hypothetical protein|uniref:hypothetical protein n=1 Tax=Aquabacterium sp. TaxID=1872578 RepID=UPI003BB02943